MMQCRPKDTDKGQGDLLDIRETQRVEYTLSNILSDEWLIADETNCPVLGGEATFGFGDAIKYMKRGLKVKRKGWNGKNQYIQIATCISYTAADGTIVNCDHNDIGNKAIAFIGTSGVQMGWLASQAAIAIKKNVERRRVPTSRNLRTLESHIRLTGNKNYKRKIQKIIEEVKSERKN